MKGTISSLIDGLFHINAYHNKFSLKDWLELRRDKKILRIMKGSSPGGKQ